MNNTLDKYDRAISFLKENNDQIRGAWDHPTSHPAGCLFLTAETYPEQFSCGCLTQIRSSIYYRAETDFLTRRIREDERIPDNIKDVTIDDLEIFAEWQRIIDKELGRKND